MNSEELSIIFLMVSFSLFFLHHTCRGAACRGGGFVAGIMMLFVSGKCMNMSFPFYVFYEILFKIFKK